MALAKCRVCGHEVSTFAPQCVNCGRPVQARLTPGARYEKGGASDKSEQGAVACFECGHEVSVLAGRCHNCGVPLRAELTPASPHPPEPGESGPRGGRKAPVLRPAGLRA